MLAPSRKNLHPISKISYSLLLVALLVLTSSCTFPARALAAVTFRAVSAKAGGTTGVVTPALPAGVSVDDIVLLVSTTNAGGSISITNNGSLGTWNALTGSPIDVTGGEKLYVWWARYVSGSTGPSVQASSNHICTATLAYSGVINNTSPIDVSNTGTETTSDTSFSFATGISSTLNNTLDLVVYAGGVDSNASQGGTAANTSLTSIAERADYQCNNGGGGGFTVSQGLRAVAGTLGTWTATMAGATPKSYITFNLIPSSAPTVSTGVAGNTSPTSATLFGNITDNGGGPITQYGFATSTSPTLAAGSTATSTLGTGSIGEYSGPVNLPTSDTTYYYRAYATTAGGTSFGTIRVFFNGNANVTRIMYLFEGFMVRFHSGRIILNQH